MRIKDWASYRFNHLKFGAKRRNVEFLLTKEDFVMWYDLQKKRCVYCRLTRKQIEQLPENYISIDRKDNDGPYSLGNIAVSCLRCNFIKQDIIKFETMVKIGPILRKQYLHDISVLSPQQVPLDEALTEELDHPPSRNSQTISLQSLPPPTIIPPPEAQHQP